MESFHEILQCSVCYTPFNYSTHEPYVLLCGHNICKQSIKKLFHNEVIECPICRKECSYEKKEDVGKNYTLLKMIKTMQTQSFLNIPENPFHVVFTQIPKLKEMIELENRAIEEYFEKLLKIKERIIMYNNNLVKGIEAYKIV